MNDSLQAVSGKLGQLVVQDADEEAAPRLQFFIEIECLPIEIEGKEETPLLRVDEISVEGKSWRDLADTQHKFPWAPKPGSVDAGIILEGGRSLADVVRLDFGELAADRLPVSFSAEVDFEDEGHCPELGQVTLVVDHLALEVAPLRVTTRLAKLCKDDPSEIEAALSPLIRREDYGEVTAVPGGFELPAQ